MLAKNLRKSLLNYAISGALSAKWRKDNPTNFNNGKFSELPNASFAIPNSWQWVKLGEIGKWKSGSTPSRNENAYYRNGTIKWLKTGDLNDGYILDTSEKITELALNKNRLILHEKNTILIAMYGATIGKLGIVKEPLTTNQACCACTCEKEKIFYKFLFYQLLYLRPYFLSISFGGAQPNISKEKIINTLIPLPPLDEQEFIVKELEKLMVLCDDCEKEYKALKQANAELHKLDKSLLNYAISGALSAKWRQDNPINSKNDKFLELPHAPFAIPNSWQWVKLGEICEISSGGTPSRSNPEFWVNGTIPWVKIADIKSDYLDKTSEFITQKGLDNSSAKIFTKGTLLYTIFATLGEATILNIDASTNQAIAGIKANKEYEPYIYTKFLLYVLKNMKEYVINLGRGPAQKNINQGILKNLYIPLPPLEEQKFIVGELNKLMGLCDELKGF